MTVLKEEFKCPKCKKKNRIKIHEEINNDLIDKIITRELFTFECKDCHEKIIVDYPLKIVGKNYLIYYTPGKNLEINDNSKEILRVCDTFDDLKEKLLILEDELNDIVIEFIKMFLIRQLDKEIKDEMTDIRYDGKNEENLLFYLIGPNKTIGCNIEFYNNIFKRMKLKRIEKCVVIDSNTFDKYYKMRLI